VAAELGAKPPVVRQTIWRLRRVWERMHSEPSLGDSPDESAIVAARLPNDMLKLYARGKTIRQISKKLHKSPTTVIHILKSLGYKPRPSSPYPMANWNPEEIKSMYCAGKSVHTIALEIGYPARTGNNRIRYFLIREGLYRSRRNTRG